MAVGPGRSRNRLAAAGAFLAATGVAVGAFGTHALGTRLSPGALDVFETGARYQLLHGVALLAVAVAVTLWPGRLGQSGGWLLFVGTLVFSSSLYAVALTGVGAWGAVAPIGGVLLLMGWTALGLHLWRRSAEPS